MKSKTWKTLHSSQKTNWETPPNVFEQLNSMFGPFDLDAAADESNSKVPNNFISEKENALSCDWGTRGTNIWINPPYGRGINKWIEKAASESKKYPELYITMLIPARTDTKWWHDIVMKHAATIHFVKGRIAFLKDGEQGEYCPMGLAIVRFDEILSSGQEQPMYGSIGSFKK